MCVQEDELRGLGKGLKDVNFRWGRKSRVKFMKKEVLLKGFGCVGRRVDLHSVWGKDQSRGGWKGV